MIPDKVHGMLGLARRAGKLLIGTENVLRQIRGKHATLVILATDASSNTTKTIENKCGTYDIPVIRRYTADELNAAVGKDDAKVFAVTDRSFAEALICRIEHID